MSERVNASGLAVAKPLYDLIADEIAPGTGIAPEAFWRPWPTSSPSLGRATARCWSDATHCKLTSTNGISRAAVQPLDLRRLPELSDRDRLPGTGRAGLPRRPPTMSTPRSPSVAGPQLVVPVNNARYALNAANARWGSLYDALYGTDAIA